MKNKKLEEQETANRAKAFDKAFTDKTYSVAKKVLDNVEKVTDYDYDALFERVNKAIDGKLPKMTRTLTPEEREERSKEFDQKIETKVKNFNIDDYLQSQKNYKDSIIEKTRKNIQKKYAEADQRHSKRHNKDVKPDSTSVGISIDLDLGSKKVKSPTIKTIQEETISKDVVIENVTSLNETSEVESEALIIQSTIEPEIKSDDSILQNEEIVLEEATLEEISVEEPVIETPVAEPIQVEDILEEVHSEPINESYHEASTPDKIKEEAAEETDEAKINVNYSKDELNRNNRYFKNRKKTKFAKRMKVELEDSIIGQQKRSLKRLFKFSLSFKLSSVFIILIILTVVSLSVAFYLGIDFVLLLQQQGKIEDIQFFRDVLIVLLIIFDLAAILICISLGTKASRELVSPIDEMTHIVKEINANEMDRRLNVKGMHDELKELAMTFNEMLDRIESSYETQNRFTSDASHELRTPIAVIQGYINMLDRWGKADGEILDESIEAIKSESHNMKRLTEKLLLLAKADKGILEMEFKPFELNELVDEITRETQMIDSEHTITNKINVVKTIHADRESLKQAIRIFVDNAVKYTPEGGTVSINSFINKKKIYIEIEDNGIGISKEDMENIFNRFYRVDKSRSKDSGGHGLGLSIAKWIINQHKGEIEIKSELNKGTIVTLILSPMKE